jgi:multidrug efflux pump
MSSISHIKEFFLSSWAINNRVTTYVLTVLVMIIGIWSFNALPKENFPEIAIPMIYIGTPYPGNSPENIERNISYHIEKELKSIKGVKKIKSQSIQDFSVVIVEFETNVEISEAKKEVKDAVDRARSNLPNDLDMEPLVQDINLSEIPIMFINVSGDLPLSELKKYSEALQDQIETLPEIRRVDLLGLLEQEVQVNLDPIKMQANSISFGDVQQAIGSRDVLISGGNVNVGTRDYTLNINGKFGVVDEIGDVVLRNNLGRTVYLKDIADVRLDFKRADSYARLDGLPTISLNVIKKAGENLVSASDKINVLLKDFKETKIPKELRDKFQVKISSDQSYMTKNMLDDLLNTIIVGFILVTIILMFFMGVRDAMFVGLSVPFASLIAFAVLPWIGFTLNLVVLFTFIFALGIIVDNAIVVVENTYRIYNESGASITEVAKKAAGEVIIPVASGTATTIAPFLPLAFWEGVVGEFMFFLPITIIITLIASLLVAYVMNPVFAVTFMTREGEGKKMSTKGFLVILGFMLLVGTLMLLGGSQTGFNVFLVTAIVISIYRFLMVPVIKVFQARTLPAIIEGYRKALHWIMKGWRPHMVIVATFMTLIASFMFFGANPPKTVFFPEADPNFVYIYTQLPLGTEIEKTDAVAKDIEQIVYKVLGKDNPIVKSVITNVSKGAGSPADFNQSSLFPHKSRIQIEFAPFKERNGVSTADLLSQIREAVKVVPGTVITVEKEASGPPTAKPVNIEIKGEEFKKIMAVAEDLKGYLDSLIDRKAINGVEALNWDIELNKPEIAVDIDHVKAGSLGINVAQVGMAVRTAVFGSEVSKYRKGEDEYPIMVRLADPYRNNVEMIQDMPLSFMDMATGRFLSIPIRSVASLRDTISFGGINRLDLKKVITISSNVLVDFNPNEVATEVEGYVNKWIAAHSRELENVTIDMTGEKEEQEKTGAFLGSAMLISLLLIFLILIAQFNSVPIVLIIFSQIILSIVGVLFGFGATQMDMSIVMVGVGVVSLAGLVVNNGIILIDFVQSQQKLGERTRKAIVKGSSTRFTPIILTAGTTVLGLIPMAVGMNINFKSFFATLNPEIFFGGDNASFWGPLSWTIIFGLGFSTIVTLFVVPAMYYVFWTSSIRLSRRYRRFSQRFSIFFLK